MKMFRQRKKNLTYRNSNLNFDDIMLESRNSNFSTKRNSIAGKNIIQSSTVSLKLSPNSPAGCGPKVAKTTVNSPFIEVTFKKVRTKKKINNFVLP